jgi:RNA polymerase sigma factor (sigma-70 family)
MPSSERKSLRSQSWLMPRKTGRAPRSFRGTILRVASFRQARPVLHLDSLPSYDAPAVREPVAPPLPRAAFEHLDALYRLACRLTGDDDDAEDLVQETFARAMDKRAQFVEGTNLRAWLFRILRNLYIDGWRRAKATPVRERLDDEDPTAEGMVASEPLRGDAELERLRAVVADDIEAALRELSVDARTIVLLDLEGFTQEELAEVLGCSVGTVKSRLSRAREKLRELLREYAR